MLCALKRNPDFARALWRRIGVGDGHHGWSAVSGEVAKCSDLFVVTLPLHGFLLTPRIQVRLLPRIYARPIIGGALRAIAQPFQAPRLLLARQPGKLLVSATDAARPQGLAECVQIICRRRGLRPRSFSVREGLDVVVGAIRRGATGMVSSWSRAARGLTGAGLLRGGAIMYCGTIVTSKTWLDASRAAKVGRCRAK